MNPPPPPTLNEVVELVLKVIGALGAVGGPLLAVMNAYNKRQAKERADKRSERDGNLAEASRMRGELRGEIETLKKDNESLRERNEIIYGQYLELREMFVRARLEILGKLDRAIERLEDRDKPEKLTRGVELLLSLRAMIESLQLPALERGPE